MSSKARLILLYGEDQVSRQHVLNDIRDSLGSAEEVGANTTIFEADEVNLERLMAVCWTVPFLAEARLVVVRGLLNLFQTSRPGRRKTKTRRGVSGLGKWADLSKMVAEFPPTTVLVLVDDSLTSANPMLQLLQNIGEVHHFPPLSGNRLREWVIELAHQKDSSLTPRALSLLITLVGNDLWTLGNELEKLSLYAGAKPITEENVVLLVERSREDSIFVAVDAALAGQPGRALTALNALIAHGTSVSGILAIMARENRLLLLTRYLIDQQASQRRMFAGLGNPPDFVLRRSLELVKRRPLETLLDFHRIILKTDLSIKKGHIRGETALELLVMQAFATRERVN